MKAKTKNETFIVKQTQNPLGTHLSIFVQRRKSVNEKKKRELIIVIKLFNIASLLCFITAMP